jgi:lysophospholipase L1-like esterase
MTRTVQFGVLNILWLAVSVSQAHEAEWVGSWYSSPALSAPPSLRNATVTTVVHLTAGGHRLRLHFSNLYGRTSLTIGAVRVSTTSGGQVVTFRRRLQITLPPAGDVVSDPVQLDTVAGGNLIISVFYPKEIPRELTLQWTQNTESNLLTHGNNVWNAERVPEATPLSETYFLTGVDVENTDVHGTIVILADSMTGGGSRKWPALLSDRLVKDGKAYAVINAAVDGNRILRDMNAWGQRGPSAIARFDRDVLGHPNVRYVILFEGVNDIGVDGLDGANPHPATANDVITGIRQLVERAHLKGIKLYVATCSPIEGMPANYFSEGKEGIRVAVNEWIRTTPEIDGYFDFDRVLADPARPSQIRREFDRPDEPAHPNEAGQRALSDSIDLKLFD